MPAYYYTAVCKLNAERFIELVWRKDVEPGLSGVRTGSKCIWIPIWSSGRPVCERSQIHTAFAFAGVVYLFEDTNTMPLPGTPWSDRELRLFGRRPDREVARRLRRSLNAVKLKRQKLGIAATEQPRWADAEIALLGTRLDREVARRHQRSVYAVRTKRLKLGISARQAHIKRKHGPIDANKVRLHFGPYAASEPRRGGWLVCRLRGKVKVGDHTEAPISWPCVEGKRSLILSGGLIAAVQQESELAVAYWRGVSTATVSKWRKALEVEPFNVGTRVLKSYTTTEAMTPALREHIAERKRGRPRTLSAAGERRLLAALRRPKAGLLAQRDGGALGGAARPAR